MNQKILFIRVTENCNANCFMCNFAGNKNGHMMSISEMFELVKKLEKYNFKLIKFTGGEPLTNPYLKDFIKMLKNKNYYTSIITNGFLLPKKIDELANAGLDQIIVSIDGVDKSSNDVLRGTDGIFDSAIKGIRICKEKYPNIHVRVNTVVSDKNIELLCQLNEMLLLENVVKVEDTYNTTNRFLYLVGIDADEETSYWLQIAFDSSELCWDKYMNRVQNE